MYKIINSNDITSFLDKDHNLYLIRLYSNRNHILLRSYSYYWKSITRNIYKIVDYNPSIYNLYYYKTDREAIAIIKKHFHLINRKPQIWSETDDLVFFGKSKNTIHNG